MGGEVLQPLGKQWQLLRKPDARPSSILGLCVRLGLRVGTILCLDVYRVISHKGQSWRQPSLHQLVSGYSKRRRVCYSRTLLSSEQERDACSHAMTLTS